MKHAPNTSASTTLAVTAPGGLTAGLDWAKDAHAVAVVGGTGVAIKRFTVAHIGRYSSAAQVGTACS